MQSLDIDYVVMPREFTAQQRTAFIKDASALGLTIPVVASGDFTASDAPALKAEGVSGVLTGHSMSTSENPEEAVERMIEALR